VKILWLTVRTAFALAFVSCVLVAGSANTKEPASRSASTDVQKASFNRTASGGELRSVTFKKRAPQVGDTVEQTLGHELRLSTTIRHGNELGEKNRTTARNDQLRVLTTTHVEENRAVAVRVQYLEATKRLKAVEAAGPALPDDDGAKTLQPVAGKSYLCQRLPGADGALSVTDEEGHIPPTDEFEIVVQHMEMVGRANPLADFFAGKELSIGQTIELPKDVASKVFNLGEQFGEIAKFELTLEKIAFIDRSTGAVFRAHVEAAATGASQMRLELEGPLVMEAETGRAVKVDLSGPIAMSETRGSYSTSYQLLGTGQLKVSVRSAFRDAAR